MRAGGDMECVIIGVIGVSVVLFGMLLYATEPVAKYKKLMSERMNCPACGQVALWEKVK